MHILSISFTTNLLLLCIALTLPSCRIIFSIHFTSSDACLVLKQSVLHLFFLRSCFSPMYHLLHPFIDRSFIIHHRERFFSFVCVYSQPNGLGEIMRSSSLCSPRSWVGRLEFSFSRIMTLTFHSADIFDQGFLLLKPSHCPCQSLNDQSVGKYYRKTH